MAAQTETKKLRHGARVAKELGWRDGDMGTLGAVGGLIDIGAEPKRPRSSKFLVRRYRNRSARNLRRGLVRSVERVYR